MQISIGNNRRDKIQLPTSSSLLTGESDSENENGIKLALLEMVGKLMQKEEFRNIWVRKAMMEVELKKQAQQTRRQSHRKQSIGIRTSIRYPISPSHEHQSMFCSPRSRSMSNKYKLDPSVARSFSQLTDGFRLAIETFQHGTQMAFSNAGISADQNSHLRKAVGRDAAAFYSLRVQLQRFCTSGHLQKSQFGLIVRRMVELQRLFTNYISLPYCVENCAFLANRLFEMATNFIEYCLLFEEIIINESTEVDWLRQEIKQFEVKVCQKLEKMVHSLQYKTRRSNCPIHRAMADKRVVLIPLRLNESNQQSFLLPPELRFDRMRFRKEQPRKQMK